MPIEIIGEFGTPGASSEWIEAQAKLAIRHIVKICGAPPPEMKLVSFGQSFFRIVSRKTTSPGLHP